MEGTTCAGCLLAELLVWVLLSPIQSKSARLAKTVLFKILEHSRDSSTGSAEQAAPSSLGWWPSCSWKGMCVQSHMPYPELCLDWCLQVPELLLPALAPEGSAEIATLRLLGYSWGPGGADVVWKMGFGCVCCASLLGKLVVSRWWWVVSKVVKMRWPAPADIHPEWAFYLPIPVRSRSPGTRGNLSHQEFQYHPH